MRGCVPCAPGSVIDLGMSAWQGIACILIANCVVLAPMVLNGHAGTKYGVPFPVLARAAFGTRGANVPGVMRALVGCGWFGIQTHVGGRGRTLPLGSPDVSRKQRFPVYTINL